MMPSVIVHGVYRNRYYESELTTQLLDYYFKNIDAYPNVTDFVGRVVPLVLMDITISAVDERFDVGDFSQEMPGTLKKAWQVAYDETILSADGNAVLVRGQECAKGIREGRIAFYLHYYDPNQPMRWTYGAFSCPPLQPMNLRLLSLLPYEPV